MGVHRRELTRLIRSVVLKRVLTEWTGTGRSRRFRMLWDRRRGLGFDVANAFGHEPRAPGSVGFRGLYCPDR